MSALGTPRLVVLALFVLIPLLTLSLLPILRKADERHPGFLREILPALRRLAWALWFAVIGLWSWVLITDIKPKVWWFLLMPVHFSANFVHAWARRHVGPQPGDTITDWWPSPRDSLTARPEEKP